MKKNTLFVLFCLISLFSQAQNSGLANKSHLRDTAINQADTVVAKTFIEFENSNAGYGYSVFKAFAPGNPKLNFGYYALFWNPADSTNNLYNNSPRFYNASNRYNSSQAFANQQSNNPFFNFISNQLAANAPFVFNSNASGNGGDLVLTPTRVALSLTLPDGSSNAITMDNSQFNVADGINNKGMVYTADYSAKGMLDPLWIPNWGAVKSYINGGGSGSQPINLANTFNNGIQSTGTNTYGLGGTLINGAEFTLAGTNFEILDGNMQFLMNNIQAYQYYQANSGKAGFFSVDGGDVDAFVNNDNFQKINFDVNADHGVTLTDSIFYKGLEGTAYYGANYDPLTCVQKQYVDSLVNTSHSSAVIDTTIVHKAEAETITGLKTFNQLITTSDATVNGLNIGIGGGNIGSNTMLGHQAGAVNTTGNQNTFLGYQAGYSNTSGLSNTAVGYQSRWYEQLLVRPAEQADLFTERQAKAKQQLQLHDIRPDRQDNRSWAAGEQSGSVKTCGLPRQ